VSASTSQRSSAGAHDVINRRAEGGVYGVLGRPVPCSRADGGGPASPAKKDYSLTIGTTPMVIDETPPQASS
jgi:hypothetical protein